MAVNGIDRFRPAWKSSMISARNSTWSGRLGNSVTWFTESRIFGSMRTSLSKCAGVIRRAPSEMKSWSSRFACTEQKIPQTQEEMKALATVHLGEYTRDAYAAVPAPTGVSICRGQHTVWLESGGQLCGALFGGVEFRLVFADAASEFGATAPFPAKDAGEFLHDFAGLELFCK